MQRSVHQYRPKGQPDAPAYAPQRDLAYLYAPMLKETFAGLDEPNWQDYFKGWLEATDVTEEDLGKGVGCFVEAHRLFIRDREVDTPEDAFEKAGFFDLPNPVRVLIFERLGEVIMGGWFVAIRDISVQGHESPEQQNIADFVAAGRQFAKRIGGHAPDDNEQDLSMRLEVAEALIEEKDRVIKQSHEQHEETRQQLHQEGSLRSALAERVKKSESVYDVVIAATKRPWYGRFWEGVRLLYKIYRKQVE